MICFEVGGGRGGGEVGGGVYRSCLGKSTCCTCKQEELQFVAVVLC